MAINAQELQGQWNTLRGRLKERWGQLTDDDLQIQDGNVDQLVGRIQQKTGEAREAIENFLTELTSRGGSALSQATEAVGT
ncbi:MAG: CsbD family protein, partial [Planctomycetaceae bacterium]|nr:CsbD family protein [Planctomycetaceae bacterium]